MRPLPDQAFEFGEHILIPKERLLLCAGEPVLLTGKVFDLLVALVRRSGHLLTKDELFEEVWPNTVVQETNLTVNMSALRKALQRGSDRNVIQTVPGRGYRFVAPVVTHQDFTLASEAPFSKRQTRPPGRRQTENADAYRAYLQGRHEWGQRSEVALKRAIELFSQAIMFDPRFAAAHSGLADCHSILGYLSYLSPAESFPRAREHAVRAIGLDASLAEAHSSLGFVKFYFEWDWVAAESEFRHAIALDPLQAAPHHWYSIYLLAAGRAAEALGEIQFAQAREPLSLLVNTDLGFHFYYTGQYDEAVKQLKLVLKMSPDFPPAHLWLGRAYQERGQFEEALDAFQRVDQRVREWPVLIAARGFAAGIAERPADAQGALAELKALSNRRFVTSYGVALVHAGLGENDAAFANLNAAFEERSNWLVWLRLDPRWKRLRTDPRFAKLVGRMRFPQ